MVRRDEAIEALSKMFVTVRLVKCNGLDLSLFQFDHDLTMAVFFLNPDRTIYARYGTRSSQAADEDVSLRGLAATMKRVLDLHSSYPENRDQLSDKQPQSVDIRIPEQFESLRHYESELDYENKPAGSCIHCHQIRDAMRVEFRNAGQPVPVSLLYPYPAADQIGIVPDRDTASTLAEVIPGSLARMAGVKSGDRLTAINGCDVSSAADLAWMLHQATDGQTLELSLDRDGDRVSANLVLPDGWRRKANVSWRATTWDLRRMATGGMVLHDTSATERKELGLPVHQMALRVGHVGQYGPHARAKNAGMQTGDIVTGIDDRRDLMTESAVLEYAMREKQAGDSTTIHYRRGDSEYTATIRLQ